MQTAHVQHQDIQMSFHHKKKKPKKTKPDKNFYGWILLGKRWLWVDLFSRAPLPVISCQRTWSILPWFKNWHLMPLSIIIFVSCFCKELSACPDSEEGAKEITLLFIHMVTDKVPHCGNFDVTFIDIP